jgi:hypothetical protein
MEEEKKALCDCFEEEYAPFFAALWRVPAGWKPVLFPLRGPGSVGCLGSLVGIWLFSRPPKRLVDQLPRLIGGRVVGVDCSLGSYGMAGPGFVGIKVKSKEVRTWMVVRLWGAAGWFRLGGKLISDGLSPTESQEIPAEEQVSLMSLRGLTFAEYKADNDSLVLGFKDDTGLLRPLTLRHDGRDVGVWRGNGERKTLAAEESLDDVVLVSKRGRIWLA